MMLGMGRSAFGGVRRYEISMIFVQAELSSHTGASPDLIRTGRLFNLDSSV